jgi:hypothetical protein
MSGARPTIRSGRSRSRSSCEEESTGVAQGPRVRGPLRPGLAFGVRVVATTAAGPRALAEALALAHAEAAACAEALAHALAGPDPDFYRWDVYRRSLVEIFDINIMLNIVGCCAASPMQQANGIAVCDRRWNIAWRRMTMRIRRNMIENLMRGMQQDAVGLGPYAMSMTMRGHAQDYVMNIDDIADIL